eukprot:1800953-Prymnesium_polylepis.1
MKRLPGSVTACRSLAACLKVERFFLSEGGSRHARSRSQRTIAATGPGTQVWGMHRKRARSSRAQFMHSEEEGRLKDGAPATGRRRPVRRECRRAAATPRRRPTGAARPIRGGGG